MLVDAHVYDPEDPSVPTEAKCRTLDAQGRDNGVDHETDAPDRVAGKLDLLGLEG